MAASRVGKILHRFLLIPLLLYTFFRSNAAMAATKSVTKVGIMHYGSYASLGIACERDEIIMISSETLGYSTNDDCQPDSMCSVPYTLAKWYCRGKSNCAGIPVERRPLHKRTCGSDFTNCLRVEYHCVKRSQLVNVCGNHNLGATQVYLTSPSFPDMYPPDQNCTCKMTLADRYNAKSQAARSRDGDVITTQLQLKSVFFLLKASRPCKDWVGVKTDNKHWGIRCGYNPKDSLFRGKEIELKFRSDDYNQEMGFWMELTASNDAPFHLKCGRYLNLKSSKPRNIRPQYFRRNYQNLANRRMKQFYAKMGPDNSRVPTHWGKTNIASMSRKKLHNDKRIGHRENSQTIEENGNFVSINSRRVAAKGKNEEKPTKNVRSKKYHEMVQTFKHMNAIKEDNGDDAPMDLTNQMVNTVEHLANDLQESEYAVIGVKEYTHTDTDTQLMTLNSTQKDTAAQNKELNFSQEDTSQLGVPLLTVAQDSTTLAMVKPNLDTGSVSVTESVADSEEELKLPSVRQTEKPILSKGPGFLQPTTPKSIKLIKTKPKQYLKIETESAESRYLETDYETTTETLVVAQRTTNTEPPTYQPVKNKNKQRYFNPYTGKFGWKYESEQINQGKRNMSDIPHRTVLEHLLGDKAPRAQHEDDVIPQNILPHADESMAETTSATEMEMTTSVLFTEPRPDSQSDPGVKSNFIVPVTETSEHTKYSETDFDLRKANKQYDQGFSWQQLNHETGAKEGSETEDKFGIFENDGYYMQSNGPVVAHPDAHAAPDPGVQAVRDPGIHHAPHHDVHEAPEPGVQDVRDPEIHFYAPRHDEHDAPKPRVQDVRDQGILDVSRHDVYDDYDLDVRNARDPDAHDAHDPDVRKGYNKVVRAEMIPHKDLLYQEALLANRLRADSVKHLNTELSNHNRKMLRDENKFNLDETKGLYSNEKENTTKKKQIFFQDQKQHDVNLHQKIKRFYPDRELKSTHGDPKKNRIYPNQEPLIYQEPTTPASMKQKFRKKSTKVTTVAMSPSSMTSTTTPRTTITHSTLPSATVTMTSTSTTTPTTLPVIKTTHTTEYHEVVEPDGTTKSTEQQQITAITTEQQAAAEPTAPDLFTESNPQINMTNEYLNKLQLTNTDKSEMAENQIQHRENIKTEVHTEPLEFWHNLYAGGEMFDFANNYVNWVSSHLQHEQGINQRISRNRAFGTIAKSANQNTENIFTGNDLKTHDTRRTNNKHTPQSDITNEIEYNLNSGEKMNQETNALPNFNMQDIFSNDILTNEHNSDVSDRRLSTFSKAKGSTDDQDTLQAHYMATNDNLPLYDHSNTAVDFEKDKDLPQYNLKSIGLVSTNDVEEKEIKPNAAYAQDAEVQNYNFKRTISTAKEEPRKSLAKSSHFRIAGDTRKNANYDKALKVGPQIIHEKYQNEIVIKDHTFLNTYQLKPYGEKAPEVIKPKNEKIAHQSNSAVTAKEKNLLPQPDNENETTPPHLRVFHPSHTKLRNKERLMPQAETTTQEVAASLLIKENPTNTFLHADHRHGEKMSHPSSHIQDQKQKNSTDVWLGSLNDEVQGDVSIDEKFETTQKGSYDNERELTQLNKVSQGESKMETAAKLLDENEDEFLFAGSYDTHGTEDILTVESKVAKEDSKVLSNDPQHYYAGSYDTEDNSLHTETGEQHTGGKHRENYRIIDPKILSDYGVYTNDGYYDSDYKAVADLFENTAYLNDIAYGTNYDMVNTEILAQNEGSLQDYSVSSIVNDDSIRLPRTKNAESPNTTTTNLQADTIASSTPPLQPTTVVQSYLKSFLKSLPNILPTKDKARTINKINPDPPRGTHTKLKMEYSNDISQEESSHIHSEDSEPGLEFPFLSLYPSHTSKDKIESNLASYQRKPNQRDTAGEYEVLTDGSEDISWLHNNPNGTLSAEGEVMTVVDNLQPKLYDELLKGGANDGEEGVRLDSDYHADFTVQIQNNPATKQNKTSDTVSNQIASYEVQIEEPETDYHEITNWLNNEQNFKPQNENIVHSDINTIIETVDKHNAPLTRAHAENERSLTEDQPVNLLHGHNRYDASKDNTHFHQQTRYDMREASKVLHEKEGIPNILLNAEEKAEIEDYAYDFPLSENENKAMFDYFNMYQTTQLYDETSYGDSFQVRATDAVFAVRGSMEDETAIENTAEIQNPSDHVTEFYTSIDPMQIWYEGYSDWAEQYSSINNTEEAVLELVTNGSVDVQDPMNSLHKYNDDVAIYDESTDIPDAYYYSTDASLTTQEPKLEDINGRLSAKNKNNFQKDNDKQLHKFLDAQKEGPIGGILLTEEELKSISEDVKPNLNMAHSGRDALNGNKRFVNLDNWNNHNEQFQHSSTELKGSRIETNNGTELKSSQDIKPPIIHSTPNEKGEGQINSDKDSVSENLKQLDLNNDEKYVNFFKMLKEPSTTSTVPDVQIQSASKKSKNNLVDTKLQTAPYYEDYTKTYDDYVQVYGDVSEALFEASTTTSYPADSNNYIMENLEELYELLNELESELENATLDESDQKEFPSNISLGNENDKTSSLFIEAKEGGSSVYDNGFGFKDNVANNVRLIPQQSFPNKVDPIGDVSNANEYNPDHWWNSYWQNKRIDSWQSHEDSEKQSHTPHEGWGFPLPHIPNETRVPPQLQLQYGEFSRADQLGAYQALGPPTDDTKSGPIFYNDHPQDIMKNLQPTEHRETSDSLKIFRPHTPSFPENQLQTVDSPHSPNNLLTTYNKPMEGDVHFDQQPIDNLLPYKLSYELLVENTETNEELNPKQSLEETEHQSLNMVAERKAREKQYLGLHNYVDDVRDYELGETNLATSPVLWESVNDNDSDTYDTNNRQLNKLNLSNRDKTYNKDSKQLPDDYKEDHLSHVLPYDNVDTVGIEELTSKHIGFDDDQQLTQLEMDPFPNFPTAFEESEIPETGFAQDRSFFKNAKMQLPLLPVFSNQHDDHFENSHKAKQSTELKSAILNDILINTNFQNENEIAHGTIRPPPELSIADDLLPHDKSSYKHSDMLSTDNTSLENHDATSVKLPNSEPFDNGQRAEVLPLDVFRNEIGDEYRNGIGDTYHFAPEADVDSQGIENLAQNHDMAVISDFTHEISGLSEDKNVNLQLHSGAEITHTNDVERNEELSGSSASGSQNEKYPGAFAGLEKSGIITEDAIPQFGDWHWPINDDIEQSHDFDFVANEKPWDRLPVHGVLDYSPLQEDIQERMKPMYDDSYQDYHRDDTLNEIVNSKFESIYEMNDENRDRAKSNAMFLDEDHLRRDANGIVKPLLSPKDRFHDWKNRLREENSKPDERFHISMPIPADGVMHETLSDDRNENPLRHRDMISDNLDYDYRERQAWESDTISRDGAMTWWQQAKERENTGYTQPNSNNAAGLTTQHKSPLHTKRPDHTIKPGRELPSHMPQQEKSDSTAQDPGSRTEEGLMEIDRNLYGRVKTYLEKKMMQTQMMRTTTDKDLEYSEMAAISERQNTKKKGMSKDTVWVLLVLAAIGWIIFMVMVGLLIYYKRDRMCYRKFGRRSAYTSSYASSMPKHLMFPDLHSPLCSLSQPQLSSGQPSPNTQASRQGSTNSAESLLGIAAHNQHLARTKSKPDHRLQINALTLGDNRSSGSHSPRSISDSMSDRPLPPVPGTSSSIDKSPVGHKRTPSSFCPEMMFGANTSKSDENMAAQSNMIGISDTDLILLDKKSTKSIHDTFRSNKSHYQSLNTIRSRKAKSRGSTPETKRPDNNDDAIFSASMHHLETSFEDIQRETENRLRSNNVESWVFTNPHLDKDDPQLVISHINIRSPRPDQRKQITPLNMSTFVHPNEGPSKTSSPTQPKANRIKLTVDKNNKFIPENTKRTPPLGGPSERANSQKKPDSPMAHVHKSIPHNYQQLSTPFTNRKPNKPIRADIIRTQNPALQKAPPPAKPRRADRSASNKSLVTSDGDNSHDSNSMDAIFQSLTQIANKYGSTSDDSPKSPSPSSSKCSTISVAPPVPPPPKASPPLKRPQGPGQPVSYAGPMKQVGPLYQNTQHLKTNNVMAVAPPTLPDVHGKQKETLKSPPKMAQSIESLKRDAKPQSDAASPKDGQRTNEKATDLNTKKTNANVATLSPKNTKAQPSHTEKGATASPKVKKTKSGSYDLVLSETPDIINQHGGGLPREPNKAELRPSYDSDTQSLSDDEPVLLKEHRKLPGDINIPGNGPEDGATNNGQRPQGASSPRQQKGHHKKKSKVQSKPPRERSQFAQASMMLMNTCPDLQRAQQQQQCAFDDIPMFPFNPNYRSSAHDQTQRIINTISKKPGSSAERIRKIIPEQASLFNEKVKPELNRILNERNVKRDSVKV